MATAVNSVLLFFLFASNIIYQPLYRINTRCYEGCNYTNVSIVIQFGFVKLCFTLKIPFWTALTAIYPHLSTNSANVYVSYPLVMSGDKQKNGYCSLYTTKQKDCT